MPILVQKRRFNSGKLFDMLFDLKYLFDKYNVQSNGVIQVGAHHGNEIDSFLSNNVKKIICFEPAPENFKRLKEKENSSIKTYNLALGNKNDFVEMFIETANLGMSNSVLQPKLHLQEYKHITFDNKIFIQMMRLDDFLEINSSLKNDMHEYNFLCLDVQGYELEVLKGASKSLDSIKYILTEINNDFLYENCCLVNEIDSFLQKYNFLRVETKLERQSWGDAFYIKTK